jgi:hypothetical protein
VIYHIPIVSLENAGKRLGVVIATNEDGGWRFLDYFGETWTCIVYICLESQTEPSS